MNKLKKLIRYIYWCGAHINYRTSGESGDTGKMLLCLIYALLLLVTVSFFQVLLIGHQDASQAYGYGLSTVVKILIVIVGGLIYYFVHYKFKNYPVMKNPEFKHISSKKRRIHTVLIFLFVIFEFYALLVIMSPSFHPSQLLF